MSSAATVSRGARGFVLGGAGLLVACTAAAALELPRATVVALGLHGFVLHTVFGKAYSLVPAYFDRELAAARAPMLHLPLALLGALGLAAAPLDLALLSSDVAGSSSGVALAGALLWTAGAAVFLATLAWTVRDNPTGAETATAESKADLAGTDRLANAAIPVVLGFLALGAVETLAVAAGGPSLTGSRLAASHLLAVGTAALLVFAIGARLLPRLLRARVPSRLVAAVLATGVLGPVLLVAWFAGGVGGLPRSAWLHGAIGLLVVAVGGHAAIVTLLVWRAPAARIGAYGVLAGAIGGLATVGAGAAIGLGLAPALLGVHPRLGLVGFLGLTIVGVAFNFYPPAVAGDDGDRGAAAAIALLAAGLLIETLAVLAGSSAVVPADTVADLVVDLGRVLAVAGALVYCGLLAAIFRARAKMA